MRANVVAVLPRAQVKERLVRATGVFSCGSNPGRYLRITQPGPAPVPEKGFVKQTLPLLAPSSKALLPKWPAHITSLRHYVNEFVAVLSRPA